MGIATPPVQHWATIVIGRGPAKEFHHRLDEGTSAGVYHCGICGRAVVRGMGRWWEGKTDWAAFARTLLNIKA